ncbi:hypothetical protein ACH5RR_039408 [Cinchona calisaya]|uniref:Uncharacterized protein n=1 Tax=Cinchona calisaya TaxID=153742 RepID=A0ABD2Y0X2_9GENT
MDDPTDRSPQSASIQNNVWRVRGNEANDYNKGNEDNDAEDDDDHEDTDEVLVEEEDDKEAHNTPRRSKRQVDGGNKTRHWCRKWGCSSIPRVLRCKW